MVIRQEQAAGRLLSKVHIVEQRPMVVVKDWLEWVAFDGGIYLRANCAAEILNLEPGSMVTIISTVREAQEFRLRGRTQPSAHPIAAVLEGVEPLYVSPGFDMQTYRREKAS